MAEIDYSKMFSCPRCGAQGAIYLLKVAGSKVVVKQRCPVHGGRSFTFPLVQKDALIPEIERNIFRCYKCGQEATVNNMKISGPWTLIKCSCPTHGFKLPWQKIWSTVYNEMARKSDEKAQLTQPVAPVKAEAPEPEPIEKKEFCPDCGAELTGLEKFCGTCGTKLE
jgi:transcription elongation factor Elf1